MRVAAPGPGHVAVAHHQLGDGVAAARVDALDDRDPADARVGARCVWPAITRSTVVSCSSSTIPMIGPSNGAARLAVDRVGAGVGALVDDDDLDLHALRRGAAPTRA